MRYILASILLFFALSAPSYANVTRPMAAKPGVGELRQACSNAGGTFSVSPDGGGYACIVENCDGKGGVCMVACDNNNNCHGSTPAMIVTAVTLLGILQNGNMVFHQQSGPSGTPQSLSGSAGAGAAPAPASSPPPATSD